MFLGLLLTINFIFLSCRSPKLEGAIVEHSVGRYERALELVLEATQEEPNNAEAWYWLGEIQYRNNNPKEMTEAFNKSLEISNQYEEKIKMTRIKCFNDLYNDGVNFYNKYTSSKNKDSEEAKQYLEKSIEKFSKASIVRKSYMSHKIIANAYMFLEDNENNLKHLLIASEIKPDTIQAWIDLGNYYYNNEDYEKAIEYFKKGLDKDSLNSDCLTMYAQSLNFAGRFEEAKTFFIKAMERNPGEKALPFNLGLVYYKKALAMDAGDENRINVLKEAAQYLQRAYEIDQEIENIYTLLSYTFIELKRYDEAIEYLNKGLDLYPDKYDLWFNLGVAYAKKGDPKKAEEAFARADELKKE